VPADQHENVPCSGWRPWRLWSTD